MPATVVRALFLVLVAAPLQAGPPEPGPAPRLADRYGDPLPEGAVARLGSLRLRHADLSDFVFPPGGKTVITVAADQLVRTWDLESGREIGIVQLPDRVSCDRACLTPDGKTLVTCSQGEIIVCDATSGRVLHTFPGPDGYLDCLAVSPDGSTVMYGVDSHLVVLIDRPGDRWREVRVGDELRRDGPGSYHRPFLRAHFSRDGRRLLVSGMNGKTGVLVLDPATGRKLFTRPGQPGAADVSADGSRVAVVGLTEADREKAPVVRLFDIRTDKEVAQLTPDVGPGAASVHFSADDKSLVCFGSRDGGFFEPMTGKLVRRLPAGMSGRPSPDGRWIVDSDIRRLHIWDAVTAKKLHDSPGDFRVGAQAASLDGRLLAAEDFGENRISLWDLSGGNLIRFLPLPKDRSVERQLLFTDGGRVMKSCRNRGIIHTWAVRTGIAARPVPDQRRDEQAGRYHEYRLSPDGRRVAAIILPPHDEESPCRLDVWDAGSGDVIHRHTLALEWAKTLSWLPDGSAVVIQLKDGVTFVDPDSGRLGPRIAMTDRLRFSADGRLIADWIAEGEASGVISVYEVASGERVASIKTQSAVRDAFDLSAAGRAMAVADGQTLHVIDLVTGKDRGRRALPNLGRRDNVGDTPVGEVQVLPGGQRALTTLNDGTAMVWDLTANPPAKLSDALSDNETRECWDALAGQDAARAFAAGWKLAEGPAVDVVSFLRVRLKPVPVPDSNEVRRLVTDLGSPTFAARETATKRLAQLGPGIVPALRAALKGTESAEVRERAGKLLDQLNTPVPPPESLRVLRAIAVLERVGTDDARRLIETIAGGEASAPETNAARAALGRMRSLPGGW